MIKVEVDIDYMMFLSMISAIISIIVLLTWDVPYFIRTISLIVWARLFQTKKRSDESTTIYGVCSTSDLDIMFKHMNNARYVRELDFARFHFYETTGIYDAIVNTKATAYQTACVIKYRRTIQLFSIYQVATKIVYWDEKNIYLEQKFISVKDNFVKAIAYSKQGIIGANAAEIVTSLMGKDLSYKPEMSEEVKHFISCLDASSVTLRKKDN